MKKQTNQREEARKAGPKFARSVIPEDFQIRRSPSPMAAILDEAAQPLEEERELVEAPRQKFTHKDLTVVKDTGVEIAPVRNTPVKNTPVNPGTVKIVAAKPQSGLGLLPELTVFIDSILPLFPPAQQAILLRLYRWSEGLEQGITVSTPRLAAKINLDEKSVRAHLQRLTAQGFIMRENDGQHIAKFGGADRSARGLILRLSAAALTDLIA